MTTALNWTGPYGAGTTCELGEAVSYNGTHGLPNRKQVTT